MFINAGHSLDFPKTPDFNRVGRAGDARRDGWKGGARHASLTSDISCASLLIDPVGRQIQYMWVTIPMF